MVRQGQPASKKKTVNVTQGNFAISNDPDQELTTVLGSCVAACLYDPSSRTGGMNHFLLPEPSANSSLSVVHGAQAMELLLNGLLKNGAVKARLQGKLFGGSNVLQAELDIGSANAAFAVKFLEAEGIPCISKRLGGYNAMRVRFSPTSGEVFVRMVSNTSVQISGRKLPPPPPNVTLF